MTFLALHILQPVLVFRCGRLEHGATDGVAGVGVPSMLDTDGDSGGISTVVLVYRCEGTKTYDSVNRESGVAGNGSCTSG